MSDSQDSKRSLLIRFPDKADLFCYDLPTRPRKDIGKVLVTGATGYIGGRLIPALLEKGCQVRCMVRDEQKIKDKAWYKSVDVVCADVFAVNSLQKALAGIDVAYYLIHSMSTGKDFYKQDLSAAQNFADAAGKAEVKQLIYLGGLGHPESDLSAHLRSRQETGAVLHRSSVPVTEFRAAIIVGSGSLSFEMIRYLTERVPVMICPSWVYTKVQPIAVDDVIRYLILAVANEASFNKIIEIGGSDVITYREMMLGYARARGLKRFMIPVPVLTPRLSSYWVHLVTPLEGTIAKPLIDGLKNEVVVTNDLVRQLFPGMRHQLSGRGKGNNKWLETVKNSVSLSAISLFVFSFHQPLSSVCLKGLS